MKNFECLCVRKILWSKVGQTDEKNILKRYGYRLLAAIPEERIWNYYYRMVARTNRKETRMVRILTFPIPNKKYGYYRNWYENSVDTMFEGKIFQGIKEKDYDSYLSFKFGEYRRLPPMEKRKIHLVMEIRLLDNGKQT